MPDPIQTAAPDVPDAPPVIHRFRLAGPPAWLIRRPEAPPQPRQPPPRKAKAKASPPQPAHDPHMSALLTNILVAQHAQWSSGFWNFLAVMMVIAVLLLAGAVIHSAASGVLRALSSALAPIAGAYMRSDERAAAARGILPLQMDDTLTVSAKDSAAWTPDPESK